MSLAALEVVAAVAVAAVMAIPLIIARRRNIDHGEARFDSKTGKIKNDE